MIDIPGTPYYYLTTNQSDEGFTPCSPPPKFQILPIKTSSLKPIGEFESFEHKPPVLLAINLFYSDDFVYDTTSNQAVI